MSYAIRNGGLVRERSATSAGYEGHVGALPARLIETHDDYVVRVQDDWGATESSELDVRIKPAFTTTRRRPVLVVRFYHGEEQAVGSVVAVDNEGGQIVIDYPEGVEEAFDPIEWFRELTGSLEALSDDFVRYTAGSSRWPESIEEAERRGLEPEEVPLGPDPIAGDEQERV